jgi:CDP-diacylglycerol---serine O-phosphatidyltransferase
MRNLRHLPNVLTCCNLLCGCLGLLAVTHQAFYYGGAFHRESDAALFVILGAIFDFLDGLAARLLKSYSPIGKQLDSLADMVTFGVLPSSILYSLLNASLYDNYLKQISNLGISIDLLSILAFSIAIFSALRLAKFNIDERQTDQFIGLPTPANALVVASLPFILQSHPEWNKYIDNPITLLVYIIVISGLMVAELPLFALKFRHFRWVGNELRYGFLLVSAALLAVFQIAAVPLIVALYVLLSIIFKERTAPTNHS